MKNISKIYRSLALFMSITMLMANFSLAIDIHYCQSHIKSVSLFGKAKNCAQMPVSNHCATKQNEPALSICKNEAKGCCTDKTILLKGELEHSTLPSSFMVSEELPILFAPFSSIQIAETDYSLQQLSHTHYKPPLLFRDIPILVQNFLL